MPFEMINILTAGFQHETNVFASSRATLSDFEMADSWPGLLVGENVRPGLKGTTIPLAGFIAAVDDHNRDHPDSQINLIPTCWASAEPSSFVADEAYETITEIILTGIHDHPNIDGIYLDLHGAMVTDSHPDGEGELLTRIRKKVGDRLPVVISLDLHANLTETMVKNASAITIFRTYPHLDMAQTGARALPILLQLMDGVDYYAEWRQLPYLIPLQAQYTGGKPIKTLYDAVVKMDQAPHQWAEFAAGFPASDIADAGPSFLTYSTHKHNAETMLQTLYQQGIAEEQNFDVSLLDADQAVAHALHAHQQTGKPSIIADVQDNPGAGGSSDTTGLIAALIKAKADQSIVGMINDPEIARKAHIAGEGAMIAGELGGKSDGVSIPGPFLVEKITNGIFPFGGEMYKGCIADAGPCALLSIPHSDADIKLVVSSKRCQNLDQSIFKHIGVEPADAAVIVVKSTVHFRADYEPLGGVIINAFSPGAHPCNLDDVTFSHLRKEVRVIPKTKRSS